MLLQNIWLLRGTVKYLLESPKWSISCWNLHPLGLELLFLDDREPAQARQIPQGTGKVPRSHSLGRILLAVVKRWDWEGGWAHTRLCASERRAQWSGEPGNVGFSEPLHLSRVYWLFNTLKLRFCLVFCKLGQQSTTFYSVCKVLSCSLLCYSCYKDSRDWGGFSRSLPMYLFTKYLIY